MHAKFAIVALGLVACLAAPLFLASAASQRSPATLIPLGKPVIVNMQAAAVTGNQGGYNGTILSYDEQWIVMRIPDDKIIWCPVAGVASITVDASVLDDKPQTAPSEQ